MNNPSFSTITINLHNFFLVYVKKIMTLPCFLLHILNTPSLTACLLFPFFRHLIPAYLPSPSHPLSPPPHRPPLLPGPGALSPCHSLTAEALTGMQKLCSSLCSNSVGSRNSDSRPTSPFRHHFLPHSQGKGPTQLFATHPSRQKCHLHHHPGCHLPLYAPSAALDPSTFFHYTRTAILNGQTHVIGKPTQPRHSLHL